MSTPERSSSRGRVVVQSSGRGGSGNIRSPSKDPEQRGHGPEDYSDTRGRDPVPSRDPDEVTSTGRGGRGNVRSPSRDASRGPSAGIERSPVRSELRGRGYDRDMISVIDSTIDAGVHSTGRGGVGNMYGSRPNSTSRSRSRDPAHTTGRGGVGNILSGGPSEKIIQEQDETERATHLQPPGIHSVGRGGLANLTRGKPPRTEDPVNPHSANHPHATHTHDYESTGRGGTGNIIHA